MKNLLVLFIFTFVSLPFLLEAQIESNIKVSTEWSPKQKISMTESLRDFYFIGNDSNNEYFNNGRYSPYLYRYNLNRQETENIELDLSSGKNIRSPEFTLMIKSKVYVFSSFQNKQQKKHYLFVQTLDKEKFILNPAKKIAELSYEGENECRPVEFNYAISPDSCKILIFYSIKNENSEILRSGFALYDNDYNELQQYGNISSGVSGFFWFKHFVVDNTGNVFVAGKSYVDMAQMKDSLEQGKPYIIIYKKENPQPYPISISFPENKYPVEDELAVNNKSELIYAGLFSQKRMLSSIGVFATKINTSIQTAEDLKLQHFNYDFLTKGMKESKQEKLKKKMEKGNEFEKYPYYLKSIKFMNNGTFTLVGERRFASISYAQGSAASFSFFYYGDIMVINFKEDASVNWMQKVPRDLDYDKMQYGACGVLYGKDNSTKIFYNNDTFMGLTFTENTSKFKLMMVNYDENGKESWKEIHSTKTNKFAVYPAVSGELNTGEILFFGIKGYSTAFVKVKLEE